MSYLFFDDYQKGLSKSENDVFVLTKDDFNNNYSLISKSNNIGIFSFMNDEDLFLYR